MQMAAGGKIKSLMYNWGHVFSHNIKRIWDEKGGRARRDKLAALEIDSRCLHVLSFAYCNVEAGGV